MLTRRTVRPPVHRSAGHRRLGRAVPALALGVSALALAVPTALPAAATPGGPSTGATGGATTADAPVTLAAAPSGEVGTEHLTTEAKRAGLKVGNATMGWRERGTERSILREQQPGLLRYGAALARSSSSSFTPKGVLGVDVSSYQGKLKWSTWTKRDRDYAFVKATEGSTYKNPYFANQFGGAAKAGMMHGAYHFANPGGKAGDTQARYFVRHGGAWKADGKTLPGVLDIEYNPYGSTCYGLSKKKMVAWIHAFTGEYYQLTKRHAIIYTTTDWWTRCTGDNATFKKNPLWIARYGTKTPGKLPKGWTTATFWQYTSNPIDQDVFPAKAKRLKSLAKPAS